MIGLPLTNSDGQRSAAGVRRGSSHGVVAELGQAALGAMDLQEVLERATGLLCTALDVEFSKVLHQPKPGDRLVVVAACGWSSDAKPGVTTVSGEIDSHAGYTLATDRPVMVDDFATESRFTPGLNLVNRAIRSGMSVTIPDRDGPYGILTVHTTRARVFTADDGDFLRSIANVIGGTVQNQRARIRIERQAETQRKRLDYQTALATCAQSLLANVGDDRLNQAVEALLTATQANYVFVERNHINAEIGLCSLTVAESTAPGKPITQNQTGYWTQVPWTRMPLQRRHLERGEPFLIVPTELVGIEREQYLNDPTPVRSELVIPILVEGKWEGQIGFSETEFVREWTAEDVGLLMTAGTMIGAFWEREAARESKEQLLRAKDEFLASVSHELRTPLTAVVGFGELLRDSDNDLTDDDRRDFLDLLITQASDVTNIVNDLLVAAKADIGTLDVARVAVNLRVQTAQVLEGLKADEKSHIDCDSAPDLRATGDPDRIRQVVRNLLTNAVRYGGPNISVRLVEDDMARIIVSDDGDKIPEEDHERIFLPYQRAHNAPGVAGSLGLGLSISRQLARLMDGNLVYRFEADKNVFELSLPLASPEPGETTST